MQKVKKFMDTIVFLFYIFFSITQQGEFVTVFNKRFEKTGASSQNEEMSSMADSGQILGCLGTVLGPSGDAGVSKTNSRDSKVEPSVQQV